MLLLTPPPSQAQVQWRSGPDQIMPAKVAGQVADHIRGFTAAGQTRHFIIEFSDPVTREVRGQLSAAGVELLSPLGGGAYFAALKDGPRGLDRLSVVGSLQSASPVERRHKLHPLLAADQPPAWSIIGQLAPAAGDGQPQEMVAVYALFHRDVAMKDASAVAQAHAAVIKAQLFSVNGLVLELPRRQISPLAGRDEVQWIEPPLPPMSPVNDSNRVITQADNAQAAPYLLDGSGVNVLVYDAGTALASHMDFGGRLTVRDASGTIDHATHVSGTVGGSGAASGGLRRGMAPGVTIQSYGFQYDGTGTFLYTNPGDLESDYNQAINTFGVDISNNSIGTNTETNGFPCSFQGDYGVTSALIDAIVGGSLGAPFRIVWANGNERQGSRCDVEGFGDYYSIAPPAGAKNHIAVGALNSNDDSMTSFSSWGPTDDGRMRPDISAPGCQSNGDGGVTSTSAAGTSSYTTACGTSMAAPTVTGLLALLLEDFRTQYPAQPDPRNSTLKILLAHNAVDRGNAGPDYQFGYGSVRIVDTIDFMRGGAFFESEVDQGGSVLTSVDVPPGTPQLKITLAWDDAPGTPNVNPNLVNDLDLVVMSPSAVQAFPWTLNPTSPSTAAVRTQADHRNNLEQVLVDSPAAGLWEVQIVGTQVPDGPQSFSIAATPNLAVPAALNIVVTSGVPTLLSPDSPAAVDVQVTTINETLVAGSVTLHYRYDGGSYIDQVMTPLGGDAFEGTLPQPLCTATPEFYFSAEGVSVGVVTNPPGGAAAPYTALVGEVVEVFSDDMEANNGWAVGAAGGIGDDNATTGTWTRVNPNGTAAQPEDDHSNPGTICWVTGQGAVGGGLGDNDVDNGKTTLVSPIFDLSDGDARISYYRWYSNNTGATPNTDIFTVDISNAGGAAGTWVNVETVGPAGVETGGGWFLHEFMVSDIVAPTDQVRMRFVASDFDPQSLVEAAIDDFLIDRFECESAPALCPGTLGDMNTDTMLDALDIEGFIEARVESPFFHPCADLAAPFGVLDDADQDAFVALLVN